MNNLQLLKSILEDPELETYWKEQNIARLSEENLHVSKNHYLRIVQLHLIKKNDPKISTNLMKSKLENILTQ